MGIKTLNKSARPKSGETKTDALVASVFYCPFCLIGSPTLRALKVSPLTSVKLLRGLRFALPSGNKIRDRQTVSRARF
jgi:hypothetical protein